MYISTYNLSKFSRDSWILEMGQVKTRPEAFLADPTLPEL